MSIKQLIQNYLKSPLLIIATACFLLSGVSFVNYQRQIKPVKVATTSKPKKVLAISQNPSPTQITKQENKIVITDTPIPTSMSNMANSNAANATPTSTVTNTPPPTKSPYLTLNINEPDGSFSYSLNLQTGSNPCSILNDAKNAGDIKSLTIVHYSSLNSDYVKEINGYSNNWNFSLNGNVEPTGCSNYTLSNGDSVTWKYN